MIVWLNGPFGGGKTTTAEAITTLRPGWRLVDPEMVGYFLRAVMPDLADVHDFQDWPAWRALVPAALHEVATQTGQHLVAPQSVLDEGYFREIVDRLDRAGQQTFHVVLDVPENTLRGRILDVDEAQQWRLEHLPVYLRAREWLIPSADLVIDTSSSAPSAVAEAVVDRRSRASRRRERQAEGAPCVPAARRPRQPARPVRRRGLRGARGGGRRGRRPRAREPRGGRRTQPPKACAEQRRRR